MRFHVERWTIRCARPLTHSAPRRSKQSRCAQLSPSWELASVHTDFLSHERSSLSKSVLVNEGIAPSFRARCHPSGSLCEAHQEAEFNELKEELVEGGSEMCWPCRYDN